MRRAMITLVLLCAAVAHAEPPTSHEILSNRPSGFWTSNAPAPEGYEYRWRLLGVGVVLATIMGVAMWRMIKRANRERAARPTTAWPSAVRGSDIAIVGSSATDRRDRE